MPRQSITPKLILIVFALCTLVSCSSSQSETIEDGDEPIYQKDGDEGIRSDGDKESGEKEDEQPLPDGDAQEEMSDGDLDPGDGDMIDPDGDEVETDGDAAMGDPDGDEAVTDGDLPAEPDDPSDLGPYEFSVFSHTLTLPGGIIPTQIQMNIYLPDKTGMLPGVLFMHGFQLSPADYITYGNLMASHGYIAILPKLPGTLIAPKTHLELKGYVMAILDWMENDGASAEPILNGQLDTNKIGIGGHSMGGKLALLVSSEDDRPKAAFTIDPVDSGPPIGDNPVDYPSVTPERMLDINIPLGLLGETTNSTGLQPCAPAADNFQQYYAFAESPAIQIETLGASHMTYLDDPNCGIVCSACPAGTADDATMRKLTQKYMTAFFYTFLQNRQAYRTFLNGFRMTEDKTNGFVLFETKNGF